MSHQPNTGDDVEIPEYRRPDDLKPGDTFRKSNCYARAYGPTYTVKTFPVVGLGATHASQLLDVGVRVAKAHFETDRGWIKLSVLKCVIIIPQ